MEPTKYDLAKDTGVQHQEALVKRFLSTPKDRKKVLIPGGKTMMDPEKGSIHSQEDFSDAAYTWLRHTRFFNEVRISFAKDPTKLKLRTSKVLDFDNLPKGVLIWQVHPERKRFLANKIAEIIYSTKNVVAIDVTKESISILVDETGKFDPASTDWEPYVEFLPNYAARGEYATNRS